MPEAQFAGGIRRNAKKKRIRFTKKQRRKIHANEEKRPHKRFMSTSPPSLKNHQTIASDPYQWPKEAVFCWPKKPVSLNFESFEMKNNVSIDNEFKKIEFYNGIFFEPIWRPNQAMVAWCLIEGRGVRKFPRSRRPGPSGHWRCGGTHTRSWAQGAYGSRPSAMQVGGLQASPPPSCVDGGQSPAFFQPADFPAAGDGTLRPPPPRGGR